MTRTTGLIALAMLMLRTAQANWRFDAETGAFYNSNLSNSDRAADVQDDWAWQTDLRAGYDYQLSRDLRLNVTGNLGGEVWDRTSEFDYLDMGAAAGLRYRFGLGRQAPWILVEDHLAYKFFDADVRHGWSNNFRVRGGMALCDRLSIEAGYMFDSFAARDNFYDVQGHNGSARLIFDVTSSLQISLRYNYRYGDVISYSVPPRPDILMVASVKREAITSFGTDRPYTAYRLPASTHSVSVSAGYAVTKYLSVLVSYEYVATAHDPLQYENHLVEAKVAIAY